MVDNRKSFALPLALLLVWVGACGSPQANNATHSAKTLTSISITPNDPVVPLGRSKQFTATAVFSDGTQQEISQTVEWSSSQPGVASITRAGMGVSKHVGTTTITATSASFTGSTQLTVGQAALVSIAVTPLNPIVPKGGTQQLTAIGTYTDGSTQNLTSVVSWTTSLPGVVTVSGGVATARTVGTSTVAASSASISGQDTITVAPAALASLAVTPVNAVVPKGSSQQLTATGTFTDGSTQNLSGVVSWIASPPGVATVSSGGMAIAQAIGTSIVAASSGQISGQGTLTVTPAVLVGLAVTPANPTVPKGETLSLKAIGTFGDGSTQDMTSAATWAAAPFGVATVSTLGVLTAQNQGTTTITASVASISGADAVVVAAPALLSITVAPPNASLPMGFQQQQFNASGTFSDGSQQALTQNITWATADPTVASIDSSGLATTLQVGGTTVTATSGSVSGSATLNITPPIIMGINYFANANTTGLPSAAVNVSNTGATGTNLCAMVYVFDQDEAMRECCGCSTSIDDLRTLLVDTDLTSNPLNGQQPTRGVIKIVPADQASNPTCDATSFTPLGELRSWATRSQSPTDVTEGAFRPVLFTSTEESFLQETCAAIRELGSGYGVCKCGTGD